ncbi:hypothetical protein [Runella slithyformis]|uniref:SHOCT domain-containing protein n=1 Tax=Runella slithyformis (strain ATCC 29530 / DSM 19594 / LMG 11500 / NCIMB 11436 / LSU 4) TaxID=761193 RepID=A0A7U4E7I2_RUNSL|nr:hypothetical protein [Runella slithyformis]AEI50688.1 hypothetical protein Runsl_4357 [Runella slithyformis DSM 19594]
MKKIQEIAEKYNVSEQTVRTLLEGLKASGGRQVQFNISELGGMGQWQGGMVMIGDMFNNSLKAKVAELCSELAPLSQSMDEEAKGQDADIAETDRKSVEKRPSASFSGSQNGHQYAYYASENMLEMEQNGQVTRYSTEGYALSGVQQSQDNGGRSLRFSYPGGTVSVNDLKKAE